ncbi:transcription termination factor 4, mitochondrial-like [Mercenaria mercenaria]|uniref:transcription termination factor 4, mitochondrial-like n=1 Tax=Mercenaria mercenaria TaxID=6596 RepID=UPI00234E947E|nr:transcription termination factor 4, mitochondrial-like [Mercenaria mercenaria]
MLKLSSASFRKLCWYTANLQHASRNVDFFSGRSYMTDVLRTSSATLERHIQYENSGANCSLTKRDLKQDKRYMATDASTKEVEDKSKNDTVSNDIKSLVDELLEEAIERDRMVATVPKTLVTKHIITLMNGGFQKSDVLNLCKYPELIKNLAPLTDLIIFLLDYGIPKEDITNIVNTYPDIVHQTKANTLFQMETLHELGFTSDSIVTVICNYPAILNSDLKGAPQRIEDLKVLFKTKDTFRILEKSPNLLFCDMGYILERFNYVFLEMGITQPQMRYSKLFSHPMHHIHARHMFLERAGFFKRLKKRKGQVNLNPKLETILDTTDEEFVKKFGNMTVQDYQTFKKLLLKDRVVMKDVEDYPQD